MLAIDRELKIILTRLHELRLPYALCGGLAMAVHGYPRATLDIDLLALKGSAATLAGVARDLGYTLGAAPMEFADGQVKILRISKVVPGEEEVLPLDLLTLAPALEAALEFEEVEWEGIPLRVVNRPSLIRLKELRRNAQDLADIEKLA